MVSNALGLYDACISSTDVPRLTSFGLYCYARFLFDAASPEYKWYDQKVLDIRNQLAGEIDISLL